MKIDDFLGLAWFGSVVIVLVVCFVKCQLEQAKEADEREAERKLEEWFRDYADKYYLKDMAILEAKKDELEFELSKIEVEICMRKECMKSMVLHEKRRIREDAEKYTKRIKYIEGLKKASDED